jgi:hypothetical protein
LRKLSEQEIEVLQRLIVNEGWLPVREHFGVISYSATYKIEGVVYIFYADCGNLEVWEIDWCQENLK